MAKPQAGEHVRVKLTSVNELKGETGVVQPTVFAVPHVHVTMDLTGETEVFVAEDLEVVT